MSYGDRLGFRYYPAMPMRKAFLRGLSATAILATAVAVAGCSSGSGGAGGSAGTGLDVALASVADTAAARAGVSYDDTAELVRLSGASLGATKGFALLRGWGSSVMDLAVQLPGDTGISVLAEDYAISAGNPPRMVTLLHGGQSASLVNSRLAKLGWKQGNGALVGPSLDGAGSQQTAMYIVPMHLVRADGADVWLGESGVGVGQLGAPSGSTLASDPLISALANCLGDVVAAQIQVGGALGGDGPAAVAIGVRTPASNTATPHAVACVAWSSQAAAASYAADARKALTHGRSLATDQPYAALLANPSVTTIGGGKHIVQWQADTPGRADQVFQMEEDLDLPALPGCSRLTRAAALATIGCPR